jgi:two-component system chemotaxis response regulator CheY
MLLGETEKPPPAVLGVGDVRVLVLDDSEQMRKLLRSFLAIIGAGEVRVAESVDDAYRQLEAEWPHVVITDLKMRPVNGIEFIKAVRSGEHGRNADIPIIVVTGYADAKTVTTAMAAGATGVLVKPVSVDALRAQILPLFQSLHGHATASRPAGAAA